MKQGKASPLLRRTGALRRRRLRSMSHSGSCCHDSSSSDEDLTAKTKTPVGLSPPLANVTPMSAGKPFVQISHISCILLVFIPVSFRRQA
jgi:hypothetical protein